MKNLMMTICLGLFIAQGAAALFGLPGLGTHYAWADDDGDHGSDSDSDSHSSGSDHDSGRDSGRDSRAEDGGGQSNQDKLGAVRDAVSKSKILPLSQLKKMIVRRFGSNIVNIEVDRKIFGPWIYEFKVINKSGRLVEVHVDAKSGKIIKAEND